MNRERNCACGAANSVRLPRSDQDHDDGCSDESFSYEGPDSDFTGPFVESAVNTLRL